MEKKLKLVQRMGNTPANRVKIIFSCSGVAIAIGTGLILHYSGLMERYQTNMVKLQNTYLFQQVLAFTEKGKPVFPSASAETKELKYLEAARAYNEKEAE